MMAQLFSSARRAVLLSFVFLGLWSVPAFSQLKADFTVDKSGGCSPHAVIFTNKTTGASASTTYTWQFGNGNTSALANPGATYYDEKDYTVTLTAKDGAQTSTKTLKVTVYKKPTVDFSASAVTGCAPMAVNFTSSASAGDGTISNYFWDFGDGGLEQGSQFKQVAHSYANAQKASVSLTVTNSFGCFKTLEKTSIVDILPAIQAGFSINQPVLCKETDAVNFNNTSSGPGTLSYTWDMGDGKTVTGANPSYSYNKKGKFNIKLTVKNTAGCSATSAAAEVNVANFTSSFTTPTTVCQGTAIQFTNTSSPTPNFSQWSADDGTSGYSYGNSPVSLYFLQPGKRKLTLTNTFGGCTQSVTNEVNVKKPPVLNGFLADLNGVCGSPVKVAFSDTTTGAVKWQWNFDWYSSNTGSTLKAPSYTYTADRNYLVTLTVANADGCNSTVSKYLNIYKPDVNISLISGNSSGCIGLKNVFTANSSDPVNSYSWNFGDGTTSSEAQPAHTFNKAGIYNVTLAYTTKGGCKGTVSYGVSVYKKPTAAFTASSGTVTCGNTPVILSDMSNGPVTQWQWDFGDFSYNYTNSPTPLHQYDKDGTYSIRFIATNGTCSDTISKENYITVLPGFPKISGFSNTCEGTRGEVNFSQASRQATSWTWDFGDGSAPVKLTTDQPGIKQTYTKTGTYKTVLTITNGSCSVRDSVYVSVLLKQSPVVSSPTKEICASGVIDLKVSGMENNPLPGNWTYGTHYYVSQIQYGDGTPYSGYNQLRETYWTTTFNGRYGSFDPAKENLRVILQSVTFGCYDTSNIIPLKIKGPIADFEISRNNVCYKSPVGFKDLSVPQNGVALKKWEWSFGDEKTFTSATSTDPEHQYANPMSYYPQLKVTDADGCFSTSQAYSKVVSVNGPKADFFYYPERVLPQTGVYFYNSTNNYPYNYYSEYSWKFSDGTVSSDYSPYKYYDKIGTDTVQLAVKDPSTGCTDTVKKILYIKDVQASFTYTTSYINNNSCPPVVVRLTNTSENAQSVSWNFGNGKSAGNINSASSTYDNPGIYYVTLYAYGFTNGIDSFKVPIEIKGPYAILTADTLFGCSSQTVTLSAVVKNANSFTWDFGDGTLEQTTDTFAVHTFINPGVYQPAMILKDGKGCAGTSRIDDKIVIDILKASVQHTPEQVCDSGMVQFQPLVESLAADQLQLPLKYEWFSGNSQSSEEAQPSFYYNALGQYTTSLKLTSPFGCVEEVSTDIKVVRKTHASISGPAAVCQDGEAIFTATADDTGTLEWKWDFGNGMSSTSQNPAAVQYSSAGNVNVVTILKSNGCADTAYTALTVNPKPVINLQPKNPVICLDNSIQLTAGGGNVYTWTQAPGISNTSISNPFVSPEYSSTYSVEVTNEFGCINQDSTLVKVARPFQLEIAADTFLCRGLSVQLPVKGAATYNWISGEALSSTTSAEPIAKPSVNTLYQVVGYDAYSCFNDTASVEVIVRDLPSVDAGKDIELLTGEKIQLFPVGSADVTRWSWTPGSYLSCYYCAAPVATPRDHMTYTVTVKNQYGCVASDDINIKLICSENVSIPNAFSPNTDGRNDLFNIMGKGIKMVKSLRVYSRMGDVVFERKKFQVGDKLAGWDGNIHGYAAPSGAYVYFVEFICDSGELFTRKGALIVVK
jgi:gliding motility-associated-like protein